MMRVPFVPTAPTRSAPPQRMRRPRTHLGRLLVALGTVALLACHLLPPEQHRVVGNIYHEDFSDPVFQPRTPGTATANVPVEITLWTRGGGCVGAGDTEVAISGRMAEVTPYDLMEIPRGAECTALLTRLEHKATVVFEDPGIASIVLRYSTTGGGRPEDHNEDGRKSYLVDVSPAG